ncbi:MAG: hypothetical protein OXG35_16105 [Acidobacteria bacterium]|nr:hypothetical protein [Acidobacteriota bacterium]
MGSAGTLRLLDTSELLRPLPRRLHTAWAEIHERKTAMSPTVAQELAPEGRRTRAFDGVSAAERMLRQNDGTLTRRDEARLRIQGWWARMWRDETSPYLLAELTNEQDRLATELARQIDPKCFPAARPGYVSDHRDTQIICESLARRATVLLTSNMRTIDHERVNEWAVANGDRLGFRPAPVVYQADETLLRWTDNAAELERWLQAGLMACWPSRDDAPAVEVVNKTIGEVGRMASGTGGRLRNAGVRLVETLRDHPDREGLVERTRALLPSATIESDREHPTSTSDSRNVRGRHGRQPAG